MAASPRPLRASSEIAESVLSRIVPIDATLETLETPTVLVDLDVAERNIRRWQERCDGASLKNRPHIKTHRTTAFALRQIEEGAIGITCQTIGEAEVMADAGIDDILLTTNTLGIRKLHRLGTLAKSCRLSAVADSLFVAEAVSGAAAAAGGAITLFVECDTGGHRCGLSDPAAIAGLAAQITKLPGASFGGLMTYPAAGGRTQSAAALDTVIAACLNAGLAVPVVTSGGTPDMWSDEGLGPITEYRAGTYIYNDRSLVSRGTATIEDCAETVLATVVSRPAPDRAILDSGSKALTSDLLGLEGYGEILGYPEARIYGLSEEHGHVDVSACPNPPQLGERVRVLPNHACVVANLFDRVFLTAGGALLGALPVDARGRSA